MQTRLLDGDDVDANAPMPAVVDAVEEAFAAYERGDARMPPKSYVDLPEYDGDFRSMPGYMRTETWDAAGVKWVNSHTHNEERHGLPAVMGTMLYSDPETGFPLAIMDGTSLTLVRTGAAAAVATDHLAVPDARTMGIVGAGAQAYTQLEGVAAVRPIEEVVVADVNEARVARFVEAFADRFDVRAGTIPEAAACDVLSTVTPVRSPIVGAADVGPHTHVNAMGADAEGKQELDGAILRDATLVVDDHAQCTHSGELNVPYRAGDLTDDDIDAELGEIVVGSKPGRTAGDGVTVFDSTGLSIQDVATAHVVYERATDAGAGTSFDLLGLDDPRANRD